VTDGNAQPADPPVMSDSPRRERLDSWKEIAAYLGRDVRTVRRWEKDQGLPVHRHHHQKAASIYAFKSELDAWWSNGKNRIAAEENPRGVTIPWPSASADRQAGPPLRPRTWALTATALALLLLFAAAFLLRARSHARTPSHVVLAVLPFEDMDPDPQDYLVDGLTEEMIAKLTRISPQYLQIVARTSAMQYRHTAKGARQIGQELGADYILENSIRHEGGRFRITTQLVRTTDQTHLWAENYDREARELLPLEGEVTNDIAQQISRLLLPAPAVHTPVPPAAVDPDAYQLYLKGRYYLNQRTRDSLPKSVESFQQALGKAPSYAPAYAGLADAYNLMAFYGFDPSLNVVSEAKVAADHAIQLDDSLAAAHAALGYTDFMWQQDWNAAEKEFRRALELDDNCVTAHQWYALYLAANNRVPEAIAQMDFAKKLDPLSSAAFSGLAYVNYLGRNYTSAIQHAQTALQLNPNNLSAHATLGWTYTEQKNFASAIAELQTAAERSGGVPVYQCGLARAYALSGDRLRAEALVREVESMSEQPRGSGTALAAVHLALGDTARALQWLEETAPGDIQANWLRADPAFDRLRDNPRFRAVVNRINPVTSQHE